MTHPLDAAVINLCNVSRACDDGDGMSFPGYLADRLSEAFQVSYDWWTVSGNREALLAAGEIVGAETALKRGEDIEMLACIDRAQAKLHKLADWPEIVAGPRWHDSTEIQQDYEQAWLSKERGEG